MDDKELLELAAKAAGFKGVWLSDGTLATSHFGRWNPLTNDGDALRLAVKLGIDIRLFHLFSWRREDEDMHMDCLVDRLGRGFREKVGSTPYAATRRAIVRAAVEIGKELPSNAELKGGA